MSSFRLNGLTTEFRGLVENLIGVCADRGYELRPNEGVRTPFVQARYWRRSRTWLTVQNKIRELREAGASYLAYCLEVVGPQYGTVGNHITHAIPGYSWHQWGESLDCYWVVNGEAEWSTTRLVNGHNGFRVYAEEAERLGLIAGANFPGFQDWPHVQLRSGTPADRFSLLEIDRIMSERFGEYTG